MSGRILVAGVGNVFRGDDGFGVQVARALAKETLPAGIRVEDFGIRGVHLALELLEDYAAVVLVDAVQGGEAPGTLTVRERDRMEAGAAGDGAGSLADAHDLDPESMLRLVTRLGGGRLRVFVVGCEPACLDDQLGLSKPVAAAVAPAAIAVRDLALRLAQGEPIPGSPLGGADSQPEHP